MSRPPSPCLGCPHWGACHFYGAECKRPQEFEHCGVAQ